MKPESEVLLSRLGRDLPVNGTGPMRWLDGHKGDVQALLAREPIRELADLTGLSTATILRWTRTPKAQLAAKPSSDIADLAYERGRADAYRDALLIVSHKD